MKTSYVKSAALLVALMVLGRAVVASAGGATVTKGEFSTFASGLDRGYVITGNAHMVRTGDGRTITHVQAFGLAPSATYGAHVHNLPCGTSNGGGHYQNVEGGPADAVNEIWPGFTTNASGHGNGTAINDFTARPEAQSVVIHDTTDGARIACADLS
jgi:hypothetical protein